MRKKTIVQLLRPKKRCKRWHFRPFVSDTPSSAVTLQNTSLDKIKLNTNTKTNTHPSPVSSYILFQSHFISRRDVVTIVKVCSDFYEAVAKFGPNSIPTVKCSLPRKLRMSATFFYWKNLSGRGSDFYPTRSQSVHFEMDYRHSWRGGQRLVAHIGEVALLEL